MARFVTGDPDTDRLLTMLTEQNAFVTRLPDGSLYMTWSSFADGKYRIGIARSPSGKVDGGWIHDPEYVNGDDGGHAMIFKTFDGKTKISYHAPNSKTETLTIRDFAAKDGKFVISGE